MKNKTICVATLFLLVFMLLPVSGYSQAFESQEIKNLIEAFKKDPRGPYQAIRWFCPDGTILLPNERCPRPGGIQHALHKDVVQKLAETKHIYLGQILAGTDFEDFFDTDNQNSRLKQYQMEKYLQAVDDGWIFRRARYYRGAIQAEDEEAWGQNFLNWLLAKDDVIKSQFFLARQAAKDIPHRAHDDRLTKIRALSKAISDTLAAFMDIRVKIHGQPDASDLARVRNFHARYQTRLTPYLEEKFKILEKEMALAYQPFNWYSLTKYSKTLTPETPLLQRLNDMIQTYGASTTASDNGMATDQCKDIADLLWHIRNDMLSTSSSQARLAMLDLSIELENILYREISKWQPETVKGLLQKNYTLAKSAAACGFLEIWEWLTIEPVLNPALIEEPLPLEEYLDKAYVSRQVVEWGTGMVRAVYEPVVSVFGAFEPMALDFVDEQIRASVLLPFGEIAWQFVAHAEKISQQSNDVFELAGQTQVRGLNPGFAFGQLEVVTGLPEEVEYAADKIYILSRAPADLKPVAGIATVSEGNLVSHVQLLARNLGIPNAVVSQQTLHALLPYSGQHVFYAVSRRGSVVMKLATQMTAQERALIEVSRQREEKISVPTNKINLKQTELLDLRKLRAPDSGKLCGPKAANLGQLKSLYPDKVVEGIVIPFGVFRKHFDQPMPGTNFTYWQFLQQTFVNSELQRKQGMNEEEIENFVLVRLAAFREAIAKMSFLPGFQESMRNKFVEILGAKMGEAPVFIRSDTNMEDLKDFTGAGLNLTVFNVLEEEKIWQGIRAVWASPYTERSYRWRQKYLLNPENVYPSILIIPSVNVDKSGVMITSGLFASNPEDLTVAFSRGVGGAVEGQAAESYLLKQDGRNLLLSPARESRYTVLPESGGTSKKTTFFDQPILSPEDLTQLRKLAESIKQKLPGTPGIETSGPFDIELGFKDQAIWLFQVRPYVENKRARSTLYLQELDSRLPNGVTVDLGQGLGF